MLRAGRANAINCRTSSLASSVEGRTEGSELDVRVGDRGVGAVFLHIRGSARTRRASSTTGIEMRNNLRGGCKDSRNTRRAGGLGGWVGSIEPEHVCGVVILEREFRPVLHQKSKRHTQIDMTRTIPALAAFDMVASPPLEAKVFVSPNAVFSVEFQ